MADFDLLVEVEKTFRQKAVLRRLIELHGLYEEKVLLRDDSRNPNAPSGSFSEVQYQGICDNTAFAAQTIAAKENELLFNLIAKNCFPLRSFEIDIWLDNFAELSDLLIITSDNIIARLAEIGRYKAQEKIFEDGFRGTYKKDSYYLPVHSVGDRQEMELLIVKITKLGILRQYIPMPVKFEGHIAKTIFYANSRNGIPEHENTGFREILEYIPARGFLGYFLQIPQDTNDMHYGRL